MSLEIANPTGHRNRVRGCLLAGALGDALGAPIEFFDLAWIRRDFGPQGVTKLEPMYGRVGAITDDTQMTLFTAEGIIRAWVRGLLRGICHPPSVVWHAYHRWLHTQGVPWEEVAALGFGEEDPDGWLIEEEFLHLQRVPGHSCLTALESGKMGTVDKPINNSKGCGGLMRVAPAGLVNRTPEECFELGLETAAITHGHPTGYLSAGFMASTVRSLVDGLALERALDLARQELQQHRGHEETAAALDSAIELANQGSPSAEAVETLGAGWIAEEALGIAVYCALVHRDDLLAGLLLAVNHSGDSDSTGAIAGNLLGAMLGEEALPREMLDQLEGRETIETIADDLSWVVTRGHEEGISPEWLEKYPGW